MITKKEAAIIMAYTGFTTLVCEDTHIFNEYASNVLGKPVTSLSELNELDRRKLQKGAMDDFVKIFANAI